MLEVNQIQLSLTDLQQRTQSLCEVLEIDLKKERLEEVIRELELPHIWDNPEYAQALGKERAELEHVVDHLQRLQKTITDSFELFSLLKKNRMKINPRYC